MSIKLIMKECREKQMIAQVKALNKMVFVSLAPENQNEKYIDRESKTKYEKEKEKKKKLMEK